MDIFLAVIAKSLCVQVKAKNGSNGKGVKTVFMADFVHAQNVDTSKWYLKGTMSKELSAEVDALLKDMSMVSICFCIALIVPSVNFMFRLDTSSKNRILKDSIVYSEVFPGRGYVGQCFPDIVFKYLLYFIMVTSRRYIVCIRMPATFCGRTEKFVLKTTAIHCKILILSPNSDITAFLLDKL